MSILEHFVTDLRSCKAVIRALKAGNKRSTGTCNCPYYALGAPRDKVIHVSLNVFLKIHMERYGTASFDVNIRHCMLLNGYHIHVDGLD